VTTAERIAYHRKRAGLSQRELAEKLGVDPSAVGHWEREGGSVPRNLESVVEKGFGLTMAQFYSLPRKKAAKSEAA
jgi:transcriptional regulator with XRE-family HTH domain